MPCCGPPSASNEDRALFSCILLVGIITAPIWLTLYVGGYILYGVLGIVCALGYGPYYYTRSFLRWLWGRP